MPSAKRASASIAEDALVHLDALYHFARYLTGSAGEAEDLVQETYARALGNDSRFVAGTNLRAWLFRILRNVFLDAARSRAGRERAREEALEAEHTKHLPGSAQPDALLEQEQERRRLWRALRQVPEEFRTALVLFDIEGATYDEVAAIEGVPVGTVKSRLSRGREHLRRILAASSGEGASEPSSDEPGTSVEQSSSHPSSGPMRRGS